MKVVSLMIQVEPYVGHLQGQTLGTQEAAQSSATCLGSGLGSHPSRLCDLR